MFEKNASSKFKRHAIGIIIVGFFAMYFSCCVATDALNVLQPVFAKGLGWSYSRLSTPFTIGGYILIFLGVLYSTIIMKKGTRLFGFFSFLAMAAGTLLIGLAYAIGSSSYAVYLIGAILSKLSTSALQLFIFQICAEWFSGSRGRVLGIVTMAAPLNSATSTTLLTVGKNTIGFTATYMIVAALLAFGAALSWIYGITTPAEMGLTPDGVPVPEKQKVEEEGPKARLTVKQILSKSTAWKMMIAWGILNGTIGAVMAFFVTRMTAVGVPTATTLILLTVASVLGIFISYLYGWLDDKIGTVNTCCILAAFYIVMMIAFYFGNADRMVLIYVAVLGMASMTGGTPHMNPSSIMSVYGAREYQNANRVISVGINLISSYGVQLMSNVQDSTGSLNNGYLIFGVLSAVALICLFLTRHDNEETVAA